jgi:SAM-dependent methyltransferase
MGDERDKGSGAIHPLAAAGFGSAAEAYELGRPDYPPDAIAWLVEELRIGCGSRVIDLGAGTGKLARLLLPTGARLIAVEPVRAMREKLLQLLPNVSVLGAVAESLPLVSSWADAVVAGQAFHWFSNATALREIHRVLKPDGRLGLIWNFRDEASPWVAELNRLMDRLEYQVPSYRTGLWREVFAENQLFSPLHQRNFRHTQSGDLDTMLARVASISYVAALPAVPREHLLQEVRSLLKAAPQPVEFPYNTHVFCCDPLPQPPPSTPLPAGTGQR